MLPYQNSTVLKSLKNAIGMMCEKLRPMLDKPLKKLFVVSNKPIRNCCTVFLVMRNESVAKSFYGIIKINI